MKSCLNVFLFLVVLYVPGVISADVASHHRYRETTGSETREIVYRIAYGEHAVATCTEQDATRQVTCNQEGATKEWKLTEPDRDVMAREENGEISVTGTQDGKIVKKTLSQGDLPWFQLLSFSLRPFVLSEKDTVLFQFLRPDNLSLVKLEARKKKNTSFPIGEKKVKACHVRVSPPWPLSLLWRGDYWFRASDGLFLGYEGTNGPPGTAKTVVQFLE
jgi:hypothetical protein